MTKDFIPRPDAAFNDWQKPLVASLKNSATVWGIPTSTMSTVEAEQSDFERRYETAENPSSRTKTAVAMKTQARKKFESTLRATIKAHVTYNPAVSDESRIDMGLPVHKTTRTAVAVPTSFPEYTVETALRQVTIHFRDAVAGNKAKPTGVSGALIRWDMLDAPPEKAVDLLNSILDTASPHTLTFTENQRGSRVYFALAWQNTKGEVGPWGEIGMAIVP